MQRQFKAKEPNALWIADITYLPTWQGFLYLAVIIDAHSRRVVGWSIASHLRTELVLNVLEMALWNRPPGPGLIHHSDHGCQGGFKAALQRPLEPGQYLSIRYTERLTDAGAMCSVGSRGDSYDNALAEAVNGLYKAEVIRKSGPWRSLEQVELATAQWVDWWNHRRLHSAIGDVPPAEFEAHYHQQHAANQAA